MDLRSPLQAVSRKRCDCDHVATDGADTGVFGWLCPAGFLPVAGCFRQFPSGGWLCPAVFLPAAGCVRLVSLRWLVVSGSFRPVAGCVRQVSSQRQVVSGRFPSGGWLCPAGFLTAAGCVRQVSFGWLVVSHSLLLKQRVLSRLIFNRQVLSFRLRFERLVLS